MGVQFLVPYADPEKRRACKRRWEKAHLAEKNAYRRERYATDAEYRERILARARLVSRPARAAHQAVRMAIRRGQIVRPAQCERCGAAGRIEAAHRDYGRPLDVDWLCVSCHRLQDIDQPKGAYRSAA